MDPCVPEWFGPPIENDPLIDEIMAPSFGAIRAQLEAKGVELPDWQEPKQP